MNYNDMTRLYEVLDILNAYSNQENAHAFIEHTLLGRFTDLFCYTVISDSRFVVQSDSIAT
jgi:hypothetical protein